MISTAERVLQGERIVGRYQMGGRKDVGLRQAKPWKGGSDELETFRSEPAGSTPCAVERRFLLAGVNPAHQLSLRVVAARAVHGGNDMG